MPLCSKQRDTNKNSIKGEKICIWTREFHSTKKTVWFSESKASVKNVPCCLLLIMFAPLGNQGEESQTLYFLQLCTDWTITFFSGSWNSQCYSFSYGSKFSEVKCIFIECHPSCVRPCTHQVNSCRDSGNENQKKYHDRKNKYSHSVELN